MNRIVNNEDRHKLYTAFIIAGFLLTGTLVFVGTRYVPLMILAVFTLLLEVGFLMPMICKMYYDMHQVPIGFVRFIPFINCIQTFSPVVAILCSVSAIVDLVLFGLMNVPMFYVAKVIGEMAAYDFTGRCVVFLVVALAVTSVLLGVGYCGVLRTVSVKEYEMFNARLGGTTYLYRLMLFVPLIRVTGLVFIYSQLVMLRMHDYGIQTEYSDQLYLEE